MVLASLEFIKPNHSYNTVRKYVIIFMFFKLQNPFNCFITLTSFKLKAEPIKKAKGNAPPLNSNFYNKINAKCEREI